jgi:hypothetical protein
MAVEASLISLTASLSRWEIAGYVSTAAVAAGCAGEAVHELTRWFKRYCWWNKKGGAASALLLIAALAFEIPIQVKANSISGQIIGRLSKEAAETRLRAAEIERKYAWRMVTPDQHTKIAAALAGYNFTLVLEYSLNDSEAFEYANELFHAVGDSPLKVVPHDMVPFQPPRGVRLNGPPGGDKDALGRALTSADIQFTVGSETPIGPVPPDAVRLSVGGRFPPSMEGGLSGEPH